MKTIELVISFRSEESTEPIIWCKNWFADDLSHREDGPSFIRSDGWVVWRKNDILHNNCGPALYSAKHGIEEWWIEGNKLSRYEYEKLRTNKKE